MATFYKFVAYGKTVVVDSRDLNSYDAFADVGAAMALANGELLWDNPEACEGSWKLQETERDFHTQFTYAWEESSKQPLCGGMISD